MALIAFLGAASALLLQGGDAPDSHVTELGGTIVEARSGEPFPSPVPVEIRLYSDSACVSTTMADATGHYALSVSPGSYWLVAAVGGQEAAVEHVTLRPGSWLHHLRLPPAESDVLPAWPLAAADSCAAAAPA